MPIQIIKEETFRDEITFTRDFLRPDGLGGFSFPCNEQGEPIALTANGLESWAKCTAAVPEGLFATLTDCGVTRHEREIRERAIGLCVCGARVTLGSFTCPCDCGRDYNWNGALLAPRSQWGEETGEHWSECF